MEREVVSAMERSSTRGVDSALADYYTSARVDVSLSGLFCALKIPA